MREDCLGNLLLRLVMRFRVSFYHYSFHVLIRGIVMGTIETNGLLIVEARDLSVKRCLSS